MPIPKTMAEARTELDLAELALAELQDNEPEASDLTAQLEALRVQCNTEVSELHAQHSELKKQLAERCAEEIEALYAKHRLLKKGLQPAIAAKRETYKQELAAAKLRLKNARTAFNFFSQRGDVKVY